MELEWMMLANYAEAPPGGLFNIMGGAWDTVTVSGPFEGGPPGFVAAMQGSLVLRVAFHVTELGKQHNLTVTVLDEDGGEVGKLEGGFNPVAAPGHPPSWKHGTNGVVPLTGLLLPKFGLYNVNVQVDGQHIGERPFRVLKGY